MLNSRSKQEIAVIIIDMGNNEQADSGEGNLGHAAILVPAWRLAPV
jgi:hypothetical protein